MKLLLHWSGITLVVGPCLFTIGWAMLTRPGVFLPYVMRARTDRPFVRMRHLRAPHNRVRVG